MTKKLLDLLGPYCYYCWAQKVLTASADGCSSLQQLGKTLPKRRIFLVTYIIILGVICVPPYDTV